MIIKILLMYLLFSVSINKVINDKIRQRIRRSSLTNNLKQSWRSALLECFVMTNRTTYVSIVDSLMPHCSLCAVWGHSALGRSLDIADPSCPLPSLPVCLIYCRAYNGACRKRSQYQTINCNTQDIDTGYTTRWSRSRVSTVAGLSLHILSMKDNTFVNFPFKMNYSNWMPFVGGTFSTSGLGRVS